MFFLAFITLVTGTPGAGKTLWVVSELCKLFEPQISFIKRILVFLKISEFPELPEPIIFSHGIPNLSLSHTQIFCKSELCDVCRSFKFPELPEPLFDKFGEQVNLDVFQKVQDDIDSIKYVENWPEWCLPGSVIILDEVQRVWRPRPAGSAVPLHVAALETHRHKGVDFWIVSQSGKLLDTNVRRLVNRHIHLVAKWNGRTQYEWSEYQENVSSTTGAISLPYKLNTGVFDKYKSSSLHTVVKKRKPLSLYLTGLAIVLLCYVFYSYFSRHAAVLGSTDPKKEQESKSVVKPLEVVPNKVVIELDSKVLDFKPAVEGRAETAPAYTNLLHPKSFPYPSYCEALLKVDDDSKRNKLTRNYPVELFSDCACYTDQGTSYDLPLSVCVAYLYGQIYNPFTTVKSKRRRLANQAGLKLWVHLYEESSAPVLADKEASPAVQSSEPEKVTLSDNK